MAPKRSSRCWRIFPQKRSPGLQSMNVTLPPMPVPPLSWTTWISVVGRNTLATRKNTMLAVRYRRTGST